MLWGTTGTAQALGPDGASSIAVGAARNVVGAVVLVALAAARGRLFTGARHLHRRPLLLAAAATAGYQLCFFGGVRLAGVAVGTVVGVGSGPIWGGLLGWLGRGERPGRRWAVATTLALAGAALLATSSAGDGERVDPLGIVLALGAGLTYAAFALWSKELTDHHDPDLVMTSVFALSAVMILPLGLLAGTAPLRTGDGALMVLWLGIVSLAASYLLFGRGHRRGDRGDRHHAVARRAADGRHARDRRARRASDRPRPRWHGAGVRRSGRACCDLALARPSRRSVKIRRMSEVMQALYEGRRDDAEAAAVDDELDIFEAAALGRHPRLAELLRGDESLALAWSDDGFTALHYACFFGHPDCTITLLDAGALMDEPSRNDMGVRPINAAAAGQHPFDHIRVLITRGADIDGRQTSGHTALDEAKIRNDQQLIDLLTVKGATD